MKTFARFAKCESGATAIEYGLIAALVSVLMIVGLNILGPALQATFTNIGNTVAGAGGTP